jgi:hypothetical protein
MSISLIVQPSFTIGAFTFNNVVLSAGNDNIFTVSGSTLNASNVFQYKFLADIYVNGVLQVTLKSFPDPLYGIGVFNTRNILNSFISFDFFASPPSVPSAIFNACPNSSCRAVLVFGEEYISGSTFIQNRNLISGTTSIYVNASQAFPDEINTPFISNTGTNQFLTSRLGNLTFVAKPTQSNAVVYNTYLNQRQPLYFISNLSNTSGTTSGTTLTVTEFTNAVTVTTYDINGNTVGSYRITNTVSGATDVVQVEAGYTELNAITVSGSTVQVVSGVLPMFTASVVYYSITRNTIDTLGNNALSSPKMFFKPVSDCGRFAGGAYDISWLNEYGGFNTWLFNKKNETTQNVTRQSYKKIQGKLQSTGAYTLTTNSRSEVPYYTVMKDTIVMNTDFLSDTDVLYLKTLISSPVVYMTDQNGLTTSIVIKQDSYRINKKVNQKIYSLEMTVEQSYNDYRQLL